MNMNPMSALNALKSNPGAFLGVNLPQGMNDPSQILNYLVQSGRFSQAQVNQAYQMSRQFFPFGAQNGSFVNNPKGPYNYGF